MNLLLHLLWTKDLNIDANVSWLNKDKYFINTLRLEQDGWHFTNGIFLRQLLGNSYILNEIPLKFGSKGPIDNKLAMFQLMA